LKRREKIKVTVVTGFLGAGKTTFINHLLCKHPEIHFALVENEFGDVSVDLSLIRGLDVSRMFELKNGCICCSIANEYEMVLAELAEKFTDVDYLLIETTGIADPVEVIAPFFRDEAIRSVYEFCGTICIADVQNIKHQWDQEIVKKQVAVSDFILLNKTDEVSAIEIQETENRITSVNPFCIVLPAVFGEAGTNESLLNRVPEIYRQLPVNKIDSSHYRTKKLAIFQPPDFDEFNSWFEYNLGCFRNHVLRCKGFIFFKNNPYRHVIQGIGCNFEVFEDCLSLGGETSEIVLIGTGKLNEFPDYFDPLF